MNKKNRQICKILLPLPLLVIVIVVMIVPLSAITNTRNAFAQADEKGALSVSIGQDVLHLGQKQYIVVTLHNFDRNDFSDMSKVRVDITIIDPDDNTMIYHVPVSERGHAGTGFILSHDRPVGAYSVQVTTEDDQYENWWGGFHVEQ